MSLSYYGAIALGILTAGLIIESLVYTAIQIRKREQEKKRK